ncbi:hypothetical protein A0128_21490 [Leptospira tipperaryensis]|uniref:Uncharacterized protein n=1 Tax=Leptospira tipperaryensis TaxID=2564040 RepID=A0A1D7V407_9LEPT|nr:hypothetical protein A0128_21490 [Leptospira tipperaryensis]
MRFPFLIFQSCFLFLVFIQVGNAEKIVCPNLAKSKRAISLEFLVRSESVELLISKLRKDRIQIKGEEPSSEGRIMTLFVRMKVADFERIFSGRLEYKVVAYSSHSGSYCQSYIKNFRIPSRYQSLVREIRLPDPQSN